MYHWYHPVWEIIQDGKLTYLCSIAYNIDLMLKKEPSGISRIVHLCAISEKNVNMVTFLHIVSAQRPTTRNSISQQQHRLILSSDVNEFSV